MYCANCITLDPLDQSVVMGMGQAMTVAVPSSREMADPDEGMSYGAKVGIVVGAAVGTGLIVWAIANRRGRK